MIPIRPLTSLLFATLLLFLLPAGSLAQTDYYFGEETSFDERIPSPAEFLGYEIGTHFTRHDRLVAYFERLAELSDRATFQVIGETYEYRPQVVLTVTSPENHANLEEIRQKRTNVLDLQAPAPDPSADPAVVALDYSVHGDETSSGEAAMLTAYYLVAGESAEVQRYLDEAVVLIDPAQNPDGRDRAANWHNGYKSFPPVADPADREHRQAWPRGRTNHFWHDLNRDWFATTQRESQNRVDFYHRWYPNIQIDFHEMGTNSTYYLEPTMPVRTWNPVLPEYHYEVMNPLIAQYQTEALDELGELYWTKEVYDNISPIYGSTYPDMLGGVGSTFEVGSSRGIVQESDAGEVTFRSTIRRHLATGIATVRAAVEEKEQLFEYQRNFFESALEQADDQPVGAWVFGDEDDRSLTNRFLDLLLTHRLEVFSLETGVEIDGRQFGEGSAYIVPARQVNYRLLHDIFEPNTEYPDSVFYDITAWSLVQGYGIPYGEVGSGDVSDLRGERVTELPEQTGSVIGGSSDYAYLLSWEDYSAPPALYDLLDREVRARVAFQPFTAATAEGDGDGRGEREFGYGTIVIPVVGQEMGADSLFRMMERAASEYGLEIYSVESGMTPGGIDLGSRNIQPVDKPEVALLVGDGVSAYEAGEALFLLNMHMNMGVTRMDKATLSGASLDRYNTLILPDGSYGDLDSTTVDRIRGWVRGGGALIAWEGGTEWAIGEGFAEDDLIQEYADTTAREVRYDYEEASDRYLANTIPGVIVRADIDPSHPVAFGVEGREQLFIKDSSLFLKPTRDPFATVAQFTDSPLVGGHVNSRNLDRIAGSAAIVADGMGGGSVILFSENPNFRSYWHTTSRLFLNAVLFGRNL